MTTHGVENQFKHGVHYMNEVELRKSALKPTWLLIKLVIELKQVCI